MGSESNTGVLKITHEEDGLSIGSDDSYDATETQVSRSEERDEKKEVYKMSAKDTFRVQLWRVAVTFVLLLTAVAVTATTFKLLKDEETSNFEVAFEKFSRTIADAAIQEQVNIREALIGLANIVSGQAITSGQQWPFVVVDLFEIYGRDALAKARIEFIEFVPRVKWSQVDEWRNFTVANYVSMVESGHMIRYGNLDRLTSNPMFFSPNITRFGGPYGVMPDVQRDEYWPTWDITPPQSSYALINYNIGAEGAASPIQVMEKLRYETVFTESSDGGGTVTDWIVGPEAHAQMHSELENSNSSNPHTFALHPIHKDPLDSDSEIVGLLAAGVAFDASLLNLLPDGVEGILCVVESNLGQTMTYEIVGGNAFYLGDENMVEPEFASMRVDVELSLHSHPNYTETPGHAMYKMGIYPSSRFKDTYDSGTPEMFAAVVAITFVIVAIVFFVYDLFVFKRNENLVAKAAQSNAIVSSLFPDAIREKLMQEKEESQNAKKKGNLKTFLADGSGPQGVAQKPMADLFLDATVIYCALEGFTAWSSVREPTQVFLLLESVFAAFDKIAKRRKIFKVETVGDCYVAVCGLPQPRSDHSVAICRFARDLLARTNVLLKDLEVQLGPDTADLQLRIGIHSGPVTAGVLRGERARFQLFGDTMNVCQHLAATCQPGRIQASKQTAELLKMHCKESWLEKRADKARINDVEALDSYWVNVSGDRAGSIMSVGRSSAELMPSTPLNEVSKFRLKNMKSLDERLNRLVKWNVEMLLQIMKQIAARRAAALATKESQRRQSGPRECALSTKVATPLQEVKEIIELPDFDAIAAKNQQDPSTIQIPQEVVEELHHLVSEVCQMYNNNPFHNFDHASHVVMSVIKLMNRIVAPADEDMNSSNPDHARLHDKTLGITSDPLTRFACAFSALIHDADHVGVSNAQLVKEGVPIAAKYNNRSVAEQNSLDLSWDLLMRPTFENLRDFLFPTQTEMMRFRQLVVNSVMSTDIVDQELKQLRNGRWDKAFKKGDCANFEDEKPKDEVNRKATIVIEHIIQASDISHTMQHWAVYKQWNQNLFEELYVAYLNGRMEKDPAEFWYKGEFGFFDFYIIPLTKKLKECGVFGVSSGEFLDFATKNREQWEVQGEKVVAGFILEARQKYGVKGADGTVVPFEEEYFMDELVHNLVDV